MTTRQFMIAALCIGAAFVLCWFHREGAVAFLTLIGGSPLSARERPDTSDSKDSGESV